MQPDSIQPDFKPPNFVPPDSMPPNTSPHFTLDAYAARSCPVKTHHKFDPTRTFAPGPVQDEALLEIFAGSNAFTDAVCDELIAAFGGTLLDLRGVQGTPTELVARTEAAIASGVEVIVGGWLPLDLEGHRSGRPDILVRGNATARHTPGYYPVEAKRHRVSEARVSERNPWSLPWTWFERPRWDFSSRVPDRVPLYRRRDSDMLQIAHYWMVLDGAGHASAGPRMAGLIGTEQLPAPGRGERHGIAWIDLDDEQLRTFSRSSETGWKLRSAMQRYRHEHAFRVRVAGVARRQGEPEPPPPVVSPIKVWECNRCPWWEICQPLLDVDDLSVRISKAPLDVREIGVLRSLGIRTVTDLVAADLDALLPSYLPEVRHRSGAEERLRLTARRAELMARGVRLERLTEGSIELPPADIEIDFDIETARDERVYLWGFLINSVDQQASFVPHVRWEDLDDDSEIALAREALGSLKALAERPDQPSIRVYHYSDYELVRMRQLAKRSDDPLLWWGLEFAKDNFVDLFGLVRDQYFGVDGLGLKVVANEGAGFSWRDADPGGLNSQRWFDDAVHAETAEARALARKRVLEYNEDDVRATEAVRAWLRNELAT